MKKTLAELLEECRDQAQKTSDAINSLIAESKRLGVVWPELEETDFDPGHYDKIEGSSCDGCAFHCASGCLAAGHKGFNCFPNFIFVKKQNQERDDIDATTFNE